MNNNNTTTIETAEARGCSLQRSVSRRNNDMNTTKTRPKYWGIIGYSIGGNMRRGEPIYGWKHYDY